MIDAMTKHLIASHGHEDGDPDEAA